MPSGLSTPADSPTPHVPTAARRRRRKSPPALPTAVVGHVRGQAATGEPLVDFTGNPAGRSIPARSTVSWGLADIGSEVALTFEGGRPDAPIILGILRPPPVPGVPRPPVEISTDGQKIVLTAEREVQLTCGEASITLTRSGKVLIRGTYILTRSSGSNRIKGAAVEIN